MLIVTGTGRSGTKYMADTLSRVGVRCGHEEVFTEPMAFGGTPWLWDYAYDADASWLAVPFLPFRGVDVCVIVRDPYTAVKSMIDCGWFIGDGSQRYMRVIGRFRPEVFRWPTPEERALAYWVAWNTAAIGAANLVWSLDYVNAGLVVDLAARCGVTVPVEAAEIAMEVTPSDTNRLVGDMRRPYFDTDIDDYDFPPLLLDQAMSLWERWSHAGK